jgi:two-component system OmpR family response regulator
MRLLLIDPSNSQSAWLGQRLADHGFRPCTARSPLQVIREGLAEHVEAVLVELGASLHSGANFIRPLRSAGITKPIMVLSDQGDWRERVAAFDAGADDYVVKPVRTEEVAARLRALIRRSGGKATDRIVAGDIELDLKQLTAWRSGQCLDLTRNEFRLLRLFMIAPDRTISHSDIQQGLHSDQTECSRNATEVQIARLRRKVGHDRIRTVRNVGYRFFAGLQKNGDGSPARPTDGSH